MIVTIEYGASLTQDVYDAVIEVNLDIDGIRTVMASGWVRTGIRPGTD